MSSMDFKKFIDKVVISTFSKRRFVLTKITSPEIRARAEKPNLHGTYDNYSWETINGDPFSNGHLVFEDESLNEPFKKVYEEYCHSQDAYWEEYGYWLRKS